MSTKFKLGTRPKTFAPFAVQFQTPDGVDSCIEITCKYFTRTEFGKLVDSFMTDAKAKADARTKADEKANVDEKATDEAALVPADRPAFWEDFHTTTRDSNADYLLKVLHAWNLDGQELNRENLVQLADECPAAITAIMEGIRAAATEGRLGN